MLKEVDTSKARTPRAASAESPARAALPAGCSLSMVTTLRSLARLEPNWRALGEQCAVAPNVFQCFDWAKCWCETYAQPDSPNEIHIVIGRRNNDVVFIWPMMRKKHHGLHILTWLSHPIGQYGDLLIDGTEDSSLWISAAISYLKINRAADILHLRHIRKASNIGPYVQRHFHDGMLYERAPAMDLSQFASEEAYDGRYDSNQRRRRKKIRKHLEEHGPLEFRLLPTGDEAEAAIDFATSEKLRWLDARGRYNRVLSCPRHATLMKHLSRVSGTAFQMVTVALTAGGKPVSWELGFRYHGTHYGYLTAHMLELTDLAPGRLTLDLSQRLALKDGMKVFDLMVPYDQHKESWSSMMEPVNDHFLPLTWSGSIYGRVYLGFLRPQIRSIYLHLPVPALRVLKRLLPL